MKESLNDGESIVCVPGPGWVRVRVPGFSTNSVSEMVDETYSAWRTWSPATGRTAAAASRAADATPDHRLFAYSEEAHGFWTALSWERFDHPEGEQFHRPLFIQSSR
ncbi:hypothetical protein PXH69_31450 [Rhodococcus qingshengii]|uniref:Uncharacterized protein n=1 Tax=Rhodococcus qingshengii TaxID=334542 RepID=A0AAW6LYS5_RHOSG|nr:hypothetical protein [Rhodococcus qingshengii]MDE8649493.1 hypothetical protein [Rhodococcus qingshengii]